MLIAAQIKINLFIKEFYLKLLPVVQSQSYQHHFLNDNSVDADFLVFDLLSSSDILQALYPRHHYVL